MLSWEAEADAMRNMCKWMAKQLDLGNRSRVRTTHIFNGMTEMLRFLKQEESTLIDAMRLIDDAEYDFRKRSFTPAKLWRWEGLVKGLDCILKHYTTDCVCYRRYYENETHFYLLTDGHY